VGGSVANTGGSLADLGANVTPFASIGDDELGRLLLSQLTPIGFAKPELSMSRGSTTSYSLVIESTGADRTFWHHTGANDDFDGTEVDVKNRDIVHVGYPSLLPGMRTNNGRPLWELLERARAAGATTSLDLAVVDADSPAGALDWPSILQGAFAECDIASPSLDDLTSALRITEPYSPELVDRLADQMLDDGVAVVAISAGRHGLRIRTGSADRLRSAGAALAPLADHWANRSLTLQPAPIDTPVTTNGAGDASTAGLLYGALRGTSIEQAAALAIACAAVSMSGGRTTIAAVSALDPTLTSLSIPAAEPRP
jgi:sugar/nucleoside kinase (ribokinase family)